MSVIPMASTLTPQEAGSQRAEGTRGEPSTDVRLRDAFGRAVRLAGGVEWLVAQLDERPSYASKVYDALEGRDGRQVQVRWLIAVLESGPAAALELLRLLNDIGYCKPPVIERAVTRAELDAAIAAEVDAQPGLVRDGLRERAAKRLGVRVEDLP